MSKDNFKKIGDAVESIVKKAGLPFDGWISVYDLQKLEENKTIKITSRFRAKSRACGMKVCHAEIDQSRGEIKVYGKYEEIDGMKTVCNWPLITVRVPIEPLDIDKW